MAVYGAGVVLEAIRFENKLLAQIAVGYRNHSCLINGYGDESVLKFARYMGGAVRNTRRDHMVHQVMFESENQRLLRLSPERSNVPKIQFDTVFLSNA